MKKFRLKIQDKQPSDLEKLIEKFEEAMLNMNPQDESYSSMADQLTKLYKIKETEKAPRRVDANTLALIGANLAGILLVINSERLHVITTKAASMAFRTVR
jgi:hypothetical protein